MVNKIICMQSSLPLHKRCRINGPAQRRRCRAYYSTETLIWILRPLLLSIRWKNFAFSQLSLMVRSFLSSFQNSAPAGIGFCIICELSCSKAVSSAADHETKQYWIGQICHLAQSISQDRCIRQVSRRVPHYWLQASGVCAIRYENAVRCCKLNSNRH